MARMPAGGRTAVAGSRGTAAAGTAAGRGAAALGPDAPSRGATAAAGRGACGGQTRCSGQGRGGRPCCCGQGREGGQPCCRGQWRARSSDPLLREGRGGARDMPRNEPLRMLDPLRVSFSAAVKTNAGDKIKREGCLRCAQIARGCPPQLLRGLRTCHCSFVDLDSHCSFIGLGGRSLRPPRRTAARVADAEICFAARAYGVTGCRGTGRRNSARQASG
ncbi:hypothetical protein C2845_PM09G14700 [Panicum miliaceum]|uniref:Uncharacterized protein n=1 Tax=Panicum miliaceum TaxID=4540 RepID=A0A3L6S1S6_PANMI|nr:hypothetical protein C2845_PM09G14700 [Panicum miliaceum]